MDLPPCTRPRFARTEISRLMCESNSFRTVARRTSELGYLRVYASVSKLQLVHCVSCTACLTIGDTKPAADKSKRWHGRFVEFTGITKTGNPAESRCQGG